MPGGTSTRDVVQADDLAVPLRQVLGGDDRRASSRHHLHAAHAPLEDRESTPRPAADEHEQRHRHRRRRSAAAAGRSTSPTCVEAAAWTRPSDSAVEPVTSAQHAEDRVGEEHHAGVHDADEAAALRQRRQRQHRRSDASSTCDEREERDRREQEEVVARRTRSCRRTAICTTSSSIAGTQVTTSRNVDQDRQLAGDVLERASAASTGRSAARWRGDRWRSARRRRRS